MKNKKVPEHVGKPGEKQSQEVGTTLLQVAQNQKKEVEVVKKIEENQSQNQPNNVLEKKDEGNKKVEEVKKIEDVKKVEDVKK